MLRFRNYWIYSAGLAIAWAVVLLLTLVIGGSERPGLRALIFLSRVVAEGESATSVGSEASPCLENCPANW